MILWKGIEVEGPNKGIKTLFIGSKTITFEEIVNVIYEDLEIKQLYFGAGICTEMNESVIKECIKQFKNVLISAEIDINDLDKYDKKLLKKMNVILTITHNNFHIISQLDKVQIKIQTLKLNGNKFLSVGEHSNFIKTDMSKHNEKIYEGDEVLK